MREKLRQALAAFIAFVAICSVVQLPAQAGSPAFPAFTIAQNAMGSIISLEKKESELRINTTASGKPIVLAITFLAGGGIRLYDSDSEGTNKIFNPSSVTKITYTDNNTILTAEGENDTKIVLDYSKQDWELSVRRKADDTQVYLLKASQLTTAYNSEGERTSVGLKGSIASGELFVGLGERYSGVILNGRSYNLWNTDNWSEGTDSYVNVPLLHSNKGYSVFYNSFYGGKADIGETDGSKYALDFAGPDIDLYIWTGTPLENLKSYLALTGRTPVIPEWAAHYWAGGASQWYWTSLDGSKDSVAVYREMLEKYKALGTMPTAVYGEDSLSKDSAAYELCMEYHVKMLGWYHPDIPWIGGAYQKYTLDFLETRFYYTGDDLKPVIRKLSDPSKFFTYENGGVADCLQIDYTHKKATELIWRNLKDYWNLGEYGLSGLMVDYGEYVEEDMLFSNGLHGDEMHNLQPYYYNKAMREAWETLSEKQNDYILFARAGCAGSQSFAAQFAGDQRSNFEGLQKAIMGGISASASGFSIWGSDIGGLSPEKTVDGSWPNITEECYLRWLGFGAFSPLMRVHGWPDHNPWAFDSEGETSAQDAFVRYYWLRENLSDAIYSAILTSNADGTPVMQAMAMAYPELFSVEDEYLFCNEILVCPVYTEGVTARTVILPQGIWYDIWNGKTIESNGSVMMVDAPVDQIPAFLRSGCVMPVNISSNTLALMDSMEDGASRQALLVTPAEADTSRTAQWHSDEGSAEYTSSATGNIYTILAAQETNPDMLLAYGVAAEQVLVDGKELGQLYGKPSGVQVGFYVEEDANQTVIALPSGSWSKIEIVSDTQGDVYDYGFSIKVRQDVTFLDDAFDVYKFSNPTSTEAVRAVTGPVAPSAKDPNAADNMPYFTAQLYGNYTRGYLKPGSVIKDGFTVLTYKNSIYEDFEAEYEMLGTYGIFGIAFGGEAGVFPVSKDNNSKNDYGVVLYMEHDGHVSIGGTIDTATVSTTGGVTVTGTQANLSGTTNIRTSSLTNGASIGVDSYPDDTTATNKVCVKVKDRTLTVWEKDHPDKTVSVKLTEQYTGGAVSLIANQIHHGAFKSFRIKSLDRCMYVSFVFDKLSDVSQLDTLYDAYRMSAAGTDVVSGKASEYWSNGTQIAGGCGNAPYLKPNHRRSVGQTTFLLM